MIMRQYAALQRCDSDITSGDRRIAKCDCDALKGRCDNGAMRYMGRCDDAIAIAISHQRRSSRKRIQRRANTCNSRLRYRIGEGQLE